MFYPFERKNTLSESHRQKIKKKDLSRSFAYLHPEEIYDVVPAQLQVH